MTEATDTPRHLGTADVPNDHTFPAYWPNWQDGDLVQVTWPDNGGIGQWIGRIIGERMGTDGAKPHHIEGAVVTVIERAGDPQRVRQMVEMMCNHAIGAAVLNAGEEHATEAVQSAKLSAVQLLDALAGGLADRKGST